MFKIQTCDIPGLVTVCSFSVNSKIAFPDAIYYVQHTMHRIMTYMK